MTEAWFDGRTAGVVGAGVGCLGGLWGATVGTFSGVLIPRCRGGSLIFGQLWLGVAAGLASLITAIVALIQGQPYHVWYPFALVGLLLTALAGAFVFVTRNRYRVAEEGRMAVRDFE